MKIKISRHVKNNMRLYSITEQDIVNAIENYESLEREGNKFISIKKMPHRFSGHPLKVVYKKIKKELLIITVYPLKRKNWR